MSATAATTYEKNVSLENSCIFLLKIILYRRCHKQFIVNGTAT